MTSSEHEEAGREHQSGLMAKWQTLLRVVERRFKTAVAKEEKNGRLRPETEKTVATYIKTLQAFAKEVKQIEQNGHGQNSAAKEVAEDLWALSLSRRDKSAIASILKELNLPVGKRPGTRGSKSREQGETEQKIPERGEHQTELSFDEPADEGEDGDGALGTHRGVRG